MIHVRLEIWTKNLGMTRKKFAGNILKGISTTTITLSEIEYGLLLKPSVKEKIGFHLDMILQNINILEFSKEAAKLAAEVRFDLKNKGTPIGSYDILIGVTALANDLTLVTSNIKEFERIRGLRSKNWRN